jgi:hypothetical protein
MEDFEFLVRMDKVEAPPGFEQRVMARLQERKQKRTRVKRLRYSLATAAASVAVIAMAVNFLYLPQRQASQMAEMAELEKKLDPILQPQHWDRFNTIPITERLNYSGEVRSVNRQQPRTIYILEQVSDRTDAKIIY